MVISTLVLAIAANITGNFDKAIHPRNNVTIPMSSNSGYSEYKIINDCDKWIRSRHDTAKPEVKITGVRGICLDTAGSEINDSIASTFKEALAKIPKQYQPVIVVRSLGGVASSGLTIAEAILPRQPIVAVSMFCMSACANYIIVAAQKRIILSDSFLLYHGGIPKKMPDRIRNQIEHDSKKPIDSSTWLAMEARDNEARVRQDNLLIEKHVNPNFFDWFESLNGKGKDFGKQCKGMKVIRGFVLSDRSLSENGIKIDENLGPKSEKDMKSTLSNYGLADTTCFWR